VKGGGGNRLLKEKLTCLKERGNPILNGVAKGSLETVVATWEKFDAQAGGKEKGTTAYLSRRTGGK